MWTKPGLGQTRPRIDLDPIVLTVPSNDRHLVREISLLDLGGESGRGKVVRTKAESTELAGRTDVIREDGDILERNSTKAKNVDAEDDVAKVPGLLRPRDEDP